METKAVRVFYRKSDNQIAWTPLTTDPKGRTPAPFAATVEKDLAGIPDKPQLDANGSVILDANDNPIRLGGVPEDYACVEELDNQRASDALDSDKNQVVDGNLIIGAERIIPEPIPPRDALAEIDDIKVKLKEAGIVGFGE